MDEVSNQKLLATAPYAGGGIEGHCFFLPLVASGLGFQSGCDFAGAVFDIQFLQLPYFTFTQAVARFVFKKNQVVFGR